MHWIKLLLMIIFAGYSPVMAQSGLSGYFTMNYRHMRIEYPSSEEARALLVYRTLEKYDGQMREFYGVGGELSLQIILPGTPAEFEMLAGKLPRWSAAVFIPQQWRIVIKRPEWTENGFRLREELLHELSHAYFQKKFDGVKLPLWFNEGLAQFLSGKRISLQDGVAISNALFTKRFVPLADIDSLMQFSAARARLAYIESLSAVLYLNNEYLRTPDRWRAFLDVVRKEGLEVGFRRYLGMDSIDFKLKWFRWLQKKYRWFIVLNLENLIWVAMVLVLFGALYAIRYRNRRILQQWEKHETFSDALNQHPEIPSNSGEE